MTFEEWWRDSKKSVYWCNNPSIGSLCKCIAQSAWEASQPKWTLCKDGMPDNDSWVLVYMPETEDFEAAKKANPSHEGKMNMVLYKQAGNSIPVPIFEAMFRKIILGQTNESLQQKLFA